MGNAGSACLDRRLFKNPWPDIISTKKEEDEVLLSRVQGTKLYSFEQLVRATDSFSSVNKIGAGGFGNTYKGVLGDGTLIAAKVMSVGSNQGSRDFLNEISTLAKLEHVNLIKLHGCCIKANCRILVYDYLVNGDLEKALFGGELPRSGSDCVNFTWDVRRRICIGVAEGLAFLHDLNIVHRDIKASNIFLDGEFNPKISDFGLSKLLSPEGSPITEPIVGTCGYIAPEYATHGLLTTKVDVYSFGLLMLEIISGKSIRSWRRDTLDEGYNLRDRARDLHESVKLLAMADETIMKYFDQEETYKYLIIHLLCTQHDHALRPDMSTVVEMLTGKTHVSDENLQRPKILSPYISPEVDEGKYLESKSSFPSPETVYTDIFHPFYPSSPPRKHKKDDSGSLIDSKKVKSASQLVEYSYKQMKKITGNFKQTISEKHHKVYMGRIVGFMPLQVTVKSYDGDAFYENKDEWRAQIYLFERLSDPNLVQLIGYCTEAKHRILVYEYMAHGSLEDNLYSREQGPLSWDIRIKIAIDAAKGLTYLHENERPIIHRDVKPSHILLDTEYNGKVLGFGLAIAVPDGCGPEISTTIAGTIGYLAPEYYVTGRASCKCDVYSFGVVLLELLFGRKCTDILSERRDDLVTWTQELIEKEESLLEIMDARLEKDFPILGAKVVVKLAKRCLDGNPQQRPSMREIAHCLSNLPEEGEFSDLEDEGAILKHEGVELTEPPDTEEWLNAKEIYLMRSRITELPESPQCPILRVLYLNENNKLRRIPVSFFENMPALQVLNLSRTRIKNLPDSFFQLHWLRRLFLSHCELLTVLSPKIGELVQLEVLDLSGTEIIELPKEVANLTNLRCLRLAFCGDTDSGCNDSKSSVLIPGGIISTFHMLEELSIDVDPEDERWERTLKTISGEIYGLRMLNTLKLYFPQGEHLENFNLYVRPIEHFKFTAGHHANRIMSRFPEDLEKEFLQFDRCLAYVNGVGVPIDVKKVLQHSTAFFLDRHQTVTKLSEFGIGNMQQLKCCIIGECNEFLYLLDGFDISKEDSGEIVSESSSLDRQNLRSLQFLYIYYMRSLREIYRGPHDYCLYSLKSLTLRTCPQLAIIFTPELLRNLSNLEELTIEDCDVVKSLVTCEDSTVYKNSFFLPKLKQLSLLYLPQLVSISCGLRMAPDLELISFCYCPMLSFSLEEVGSKQLTKIEEKELLTCTTPETKQSKGSEEKLIERVPQTSQSMREQSAEGPKQRGAVPVKFKEKESCISIFSETKHNSSKEKPVEDEARTSQRMQEKSVEDPLSRGTLTSRVFTFDELKAATRNFRPDTLLGERGLSRVYKGLLNLKGGPSTSYGGTPVAIERLESHMGDEEWQSYLAKVTSLARVSHPNIVKLLGYCSEKENILVFEYMQRGSLEDALFSKPKEQVLLPWNVRLKIAIGAAKGLAFLHQQDMPIYRGFTPSNILLDQDYDAKILYDGLTREVHANVTSHVTTRVMGSYPYASPEYVETGHLFVKSDVYSFGVVLLEILTGRQASDINHTRGHPSLVDVVKPHLSTRKFAKFVDPKCEKDYSLKDALAVAKITVDCLQQVPWKRPSMGEVLDRLERIAAKTKTERGSLFSLSSKTKKFSGSKEKSIEGVAQTYQSMQEKYTKGHSRRETVPTESKVSVGTVRTDLPPPEIDMHLEWGRRFTLGDLELATNRFCDVLGESGLGVVYLGRLMDGTAVAVRNIFAYLVPDEKKFSDEVKTIGRLRHKNLVQLLGCCIEGTRRMLVYEYVNNGNLDRWLHGTMPRDETLTWETRMKVILGIAKGIAYLHDETENKFVHGDIKSSNILIDDDFNAKVSDFGLAKTFGSGALVTGTLRYAAPEYYSSGFLNQKSDIYSFGVVMLEAITGRDPVDHQRPADEVNLVEWVMTMVGMRKAEEVLDPRLEVKPSTRVLKQALLVAVKCVSPGADMRPKMTDVLRMLQADEYSFGEEMVESALRAHSSSIRGSRRHTKTPEDSVPKTGKQQSFIKEEVLVDIYNDMFPCTAYEFFSLLLDDSSSFTKEYRSKRKDTNLTMGQWHPAEEYDGQVREITFRSLCTSPMCPPDTAMTEYQHAVLSPDKKTLVFETVQQAHDVPFGSYFEIHCRWQVETKDQNSSTIAIKVGAHFKKWCVMQSKMKSGAINEYKKEVEMMIDVASAYVKSTVSLQRLRRQLQSL